MQPKYLKCPNISTIVSDNITLIIIYVLLVSDDIINRAAVVTLYLLIYRRTSEFQY